MLRSLVRAGFVSIQWAGMTFHNTHNNAPVIFFQSTALILPNCTSTQTTHLAAHQLLSTRHLRIDQRFLLLRHSGQNGHCFLFLFFIFDHIDRNFWLEDESRKGVFQMRRQHNSQLLMRIKESFGSRCWATCSV